MSIERELRGNWDNVYYPAPEPMVEEAMAPGQLPGDVLVAEAGSRGLPPSAYSGETRPGMITSDTGGGAAIGFRQPMPKRPTGGDLAVPMNPFARVVSKGANWFGDLVDKGASLYDTMQLIIPGGFDPDAKMNLPTDFQPRPSQIDPATGQMIPATMGFNPKEVTVGEVLKAIPVSEVIGVRGLARLAESLGTGNLPSFGDMLDTAGLWPVGSATSGVLKATAGTAGKIAKELAPVAGEMAIKSMEKLGTPVQMGITPTVAKFPKVEGGIKFPEEESANLLRLKLKREQETLQGKAMPGLPKNEREVIKAPEGSGLPDFVVGKITSDDWIKRTEEVLTPEEIKQYSKWYDEVRGTFLKYTDNDEAKTDKYMRAWLVANQNIGVDGAFNNVLLQAEQFARNVPEGKMRAGGLPMATQAARNTLLDQPITEGVGFKISDFVDSAEGKTVRSIYGNDVQAGQPFVVDIHTARDTGLVDNILLNHLEKQGYAVDRDKIKVDLATGPTDTQYENRADFGRQLTDELNSMNWQGRSDWQPKEVQAVGWMAMTRLTADAATDTVTALERNLRRISMEAAPGEGSPWAKKYGNAFAALAPERQVQLTQVVTDRAMEMAKEIAGIDLRTMVHGTGGWQTYQNPAAVGQALATREGGEIAANVLGYLLQQTEVWVNSIKATTKNPKALAVDFIESGSDNLSTNDGLRSFWEKVMAADPTKLFVGYQPIRTADGDVGIRVLIDKGGAARMQSVQDALSSGGAIEKMFANLGYDVKARGYEADLVKARNDWTGKGSKNGETYLGRLADLGVRRTAADLDPLRGELEKLFERELSGAGAVTTTPAPATPTVAAKTVKRKVTKGQPGQSSGGIE